jgi:FecR protein
MADGFQRMASAIIPPEAAMRRALRVLAGAVTAMVVAATVLVCAAERALADEASQLGRWFVVELRGAAYSRLGDAEAAQWRSLRPGEAVVAGSIVRTGEDGNLLLANRVDRIRLSPNSELELPASEEGDAITRVIHWIGTAFFDVGKRPSPQFEVRTPYLVAVVKGTAFGTTASEAGSVIKVTEGIVGVASAQGGASTDVAAGETASVSAGDAGTVSPGDLSDASGPEQGAADVGASTSTTAGAADTTVGGSTAKSANGSGPGGGDGNGGDRNSVKGSQSVRASQGGGGDDDGDGDDDDGDDDDGDGDDDDGDDDDGDDDGDDDNDDDDHDHGGWHGHHHRG